MNPQAIELGMSIGIGIATAIILFSVAFIGICACIIYTLAIIDWYKK